jgi:hypothetical protein
MDRRERPLVNTLDSEPKLFFFFFPLPESESMLTSLLIVMYFMRELSDSLLWSLSEGVLSKVPEQKKKKKKKLKNVFPNFDISIKHYLLSILLSIIRST